MKTQPLVKDLERNAVIWYSLSRNLADLLIQSNVIDVLFLFFFYDEIAQNSADMFAETE